jgi:hypothetical protein
MTETPVPQGTTSTVPPPSANGSAPPPPAAAAPRGRMHARISGVRATLIASAQLTARITQLRQIMRRDRRKPRPS